MTPTTLENCSSREEILAFLAKRRDDGITPIEWKSWIDLALARMEAIAKPDTLAEIERVRGALAVCLKALKSARDSNTIPEWMFNEHNDELDKAEAIANTALASSPATATEGV
jgi:hypothetical protein